jgi:hypothetical protein
MSQHASPKHRAARSQRPALVSRRAAGHLLAAMLVMLPAVVLLVAPARWPLVVGGVTAVLAGAAAVRRRGAVKAWERELDRAFGVDDRAPHFPRRTTAPPPVHGGESW